MNKKGQIDPVEIGKLAIVIFIAFAMLSVLSSLLNSLQNIQTSIDSIVNAFIPLIILAIFFEIARRIFG